MEWLRGLATPAAVPRCRTSARYRSCPSHGRADPGSLIHTPEACFRFFPFPVNPSTARYPKLALLTRPRLLTSLDAKRGRSREWPVARRATHPAQLLAQMCDWPARCCESMRDRRQNGLRQKTHFASRLKRITASSPLSKNISLSFFPKLVSLDAVPLR